jgi:hypothetical protein
MNVQVSNRLWPGYRKIEKINKSSWISLKMIKETLIINYNM